MHSKGKGPVDAAPPVPSVAAPADGVSVGVRSARDDMIDNVRFILEGLPFEDKQVSRGGCRAAQGGVYGMNSGRCGRRDCGHRCTGWPDGSPWHLYSKESAWVGFVNSQTYTYLVLQTVKYMLPRGTKSAVIPEVDREYMNVTSLDRTLISKHPVQVGNWPEW